MCDAYVVSCVRHKYRDIAIQQHLRKRPVSQEIVNGLPKEHDYSKGNINGKAPKYTEVRWGCLARIARYWAQRCKDWHAFLDEQRTVNTAKAAATSLLAKWGFDMTQLEAKIVCWVLDPVFVFILWCQQRGAKSHLVYGRVQALIKLYAVPLTLNTVHDALTVELRSLSVRHQKTLLRFVNDIRSAVSAGLKSRFDNERHKWCAFYKEFQYFGVYNTSLDVSEFPEVPTLANIPWYLDFMKSEGGNRVELDKEWTKAMQYMLDEQREKKINGVYVHCTLC